VCVDYDKPKNNECSTDKKQPGDFFIKKKIADDRGENGYEIQRYTNF